MEHPAKVLTLFNEKLSIEISEAVIETFVEQIHTKNSPRKKLLYLSETFLSENAKVSPSIWNLSLYFLLLNQNPLNTKLKSL